MKHGNFHFLLIESNIYNRHNKSCKNSIRIMQDVFFWLVYELIRFFSWIVVSNLLFFHSQPLLRALDEMEKVNSQLSASVEEVTDVHRQKAEVFVLVMLVYISISISLAVTLRDQMFNWSCFSEKTMQKCKDC